MEHYSAIKKNAFESVLMRWMKLEPIIQSKIHSPVSPERPTLTFAPNPNCIKRDYKSLKQTPNHSPALSQPGNFLPLMSSSSPRMGYKNCSHCEIIIQRLFILHCGSLFTQVDQQASRQTEQPGSKGLPFAPTLRRPPSDPRSALP